MRVIRGFKLDSVYGPAEGYRYDGLYTVEEVRMKRAPNRLFNSIDNLECRPTWQPAFMALKSANSRSRQVEPLALWAARAERSRNSVFLDSRLFVPLMAISMTMRRTSIAMITKKTRRTRKTRPTLRKSRAKPMVLPPMRSESPAVLLLIMIY